VGKKAFGGAKMNNIEVDDCTRYRVTYRDSNLYIIAGPKRIDISMENRDNFMTLAGLNLVQRLLNELLDEGRDLEDLAGICFEEGYRSNDLPRILSAALVFGIDETQRRTANENDNLQPNKNARPTTTH
jgi:hypothetical protein